MRAAGARFYISISLGGGLGMASRAEATSDRRTPARAAGRSKQTDAAFSGGSMVVAGVMVAIWPASSSSC